MKGVFALSIILLFASLYCVSAQPNEVQVYAGNSFEANCQLPDFLLTFKINSTGYNRFWGNANAGTKYVPANNTLIFQCFSDFDCDPKSWAFVRLINTIDLNEDSTACTIVYVDYFDDGQCYTEWLCGSGWKAPEIYSRAVAQEKSKANTLRYQAAKLKRL